MKEPFSWVIFRESCYKFFDLSDKEVPGNQEKAVLPRFSPGPSSATASHRLWFGEGLDMAPLSPTQGSSKGRYDILKGQQEQGNKGRFVTGHA